MTDRNGAGPAAESAGPSAGLRIPAGQKADYRQLAGTAELLGRGLVDLAEAARLLGAPDPEALGAEGADWPNFQNSGVVLRAWARLVLDSLPEQSAGSLIVVEQRLHRPLA